MATKQVDMTDGGACEVTFADGLCLRLRAEPGGGVKIFVETYKGHAVSRAALYPCSSNSAVFDVRAEDKEGYGR